MIFLRISMFSFYNYKKAPNVCVDKIQTPATRKVCADKIRTGRTEPAHRNCAQKLRTETGTGPPTTGSEPAGGGSGRVAYPPPPGMHPHLPTLPRTHVTRFTLMHPRLSSFGEDMDMRGNACLIHPNFACLPCKPNCFILVHIITCKRTCTQ